jgi:hypothetical protein
MLDLLLTEMKNQMRGSEARAGSKRKGREEMKIARVPHRGRAMHCS